MLVGLDDGTLLYPYDADGSVTVRLPKGRYLIDHTWCHRAGHAPELIAQPGLVLDRDQTFDIDPTITKPLSVTPPAAATLDLGDIGYQVETDRRIRSPAAPSSSTSAPCRPRSSATRCRARR